MILNKNLLYTISLFFLSCNDYCAKYQENQIIQMKIDSIVFAYDNFNIRKICYDCSPTVTLYFTYFNTDTSIQFIKLNVIDRYNDNICLFDSIFEIKDTFKLYKTEIDINNIISASYYDQLQIMYDKLINGSLIIKLYSIDTLIKTYNLKIYDSEIRLDTNIRAAPLLEFLTNNHQACKFVHKIDR